MMKVNIAIEIFAIVITTILLTCCIFEIKKLEKKTIDGLLFSAMLIINLRV